MMTPFTESVINVQTETDSTNCTFDKTNIFKANKANTIVADVLAMKGASVLTL